MEGALSDTWVPSSSLPPPPLLLFLPSLIPCLLLPPILFYSKLCFHYSKPLHSLSVSLSQAQKIIFETFLSLSLSLSLSLAVMDGTLGLLGGGGGGGSGGSVGGSSGASTNESAVSKVEVMVEHEASSYSTEAELELGLGLSLGGGGGGGMKGGNKGCAWGERGRILTAKDFPSVVSHAPSSRFSDRPTPTAVSGTKRAADSVSQDPSGSPTALRFINFSF